MQPDDREEIERLNRVVDEFADEMKGKLLEQHNKGYRGWDDPEIVREMPGRLWNIVERILRRRRAEVGQGRKIDDRQEVDLANMAMFLWWHRRG